MKKTLSILGLIAILGLTTPAFAAPHGSGGPAGHGPHGGGHRVHAGAHHRPHHVAPHHHGGSFVHIGHHPRHSAWYGYRASHRWCPYCGYRLGYCPHYSGFGAYIPLGSASFSIRF